MKTQTKPRPIKGPSESGNPSIYVQDDVLEELWFNARWRTDRMAVGILVGKHYSCPIDGAIYAQVEGFVSGTHVPEISDLTRFLRSQWKAAMQAQQHSMPDGEIVGWYVGTGAETIEIGQDALLLHHTFFSHEWQTGLVMFGENNVHALAVSGDEFTPLPMQIIHKDSEATLA